ncbi:105_t:CDS:1 [Scutellospora calospora]|uniref:105_t:CDS:1 n=1 Tax=Scutellospora calospora TaxID=85575 RepID=A0ACA9KWH1_9GLOM|nr:105_t:CDS:1 [Scutellospora calospora]
MTGYDPEGRIVEWGNRDLDKIFKLSKKYDKLQSNRDLAMERRNKRKRFRLRKKMFRIIRQIRNLIDECHHQLSRWLCENYEFILLPRFKSSNMILRNKRKIRSKTARMMLTWSHFRLRMFLEHKAREFSICKIIACTEEYTSKTCGYCEFVKNDLGGSKTFRCDSCEVEMDRDVNGARNILLKYLTEGQASA